MRVKDIMSRPVHTVPQIASVESAAELMTARSVTALPVLDAAGALVGMVGESDLLWHRVPAEPGTEREFPDTDPARRPGMVVEVMSPYPVTTRPDADVAEAAEAMLETDVRSMPVLDDDGGLVGIISRRDILRATVRGDDVLVREVQDRLDDYAGGERRWTATVRGGVATVTGDCLNETERAIVTVLARTVPGVAAARTS